MKKALIIYSILMYKIKNNEDKSMKKGITLNDLRIVTCDMNKGNNINYR